MLILNDMEIEEYVRKILQDIRKNGEIALRKYAEKFDGFDGDFRVSKAEIIEAKRSISEEDKKVIEEVIRRVEDYHKKFFEETKIFVRNWALYGLICKPLQRIGIYVPGGKPLPSTLIMIAIPAKIAGVNEIVLTTPPKNGKVNPYILYIADLLEVDEIYKIGGVQAIAAMAFGICMRKVDKIFGPGNKFVSEAKRQVFGIVGIDSLAGPSEICIIADETANKEYVLADLLSQLEHDRDAKAWLLTTSKELANYCMGERIKVRLCRDMEECIALANEIAPEHLQIMVKEPLEVAERIYNAGAIYIGSYTPVAAADYFLGVNHVLPTNKAARFCSVLTVMDFMKRISFAWVSRQEFMENRKLGMRFAEIEGMKLHKQALEVRK